MSKTTIGELLSLKRGYDITHNEMQGGPIPVVGSNGVIGYHDKANVTAPCLVIGRSGTVGIPRIYDEPCWAHNTTLFVEDYKGNNPYYLFYLLQNLDIQKAASSTGVPTLNRNFVHPMTVSAELDRKVQDKIVDLLKGIDDKIKTNNRSNFVLESMTKTIYGYWFLQFEFPNEEGKSYKTSGGKMYYDKELKRKIPEGWVVGNLINNSICKPIKSGLLPFELKNYLPTANINNEDITDGDYVTPENKESRANMQPAKYSVWFAKMKNSIKHLSIPSNSDWFIDKYILSTGFEGLQCDENSFAYIHSLINSDYFEIHKNILAHGATQESVNEKDLKNIKFIIPDRNVLAKFANIINPILEMKFKNIKENQELASLRDFLLPMLMNGQVKFKEKVNK